MASLANFDAAQVEAAIKLDASDTNRTNVDFSRLSQAIACKLLESSPKLEDLEAQYADLAGQWNKGTKPPFCCLEGVKYAANCLKFCAIAEDCHVVITVPFYMEFERGSPANAENPNGEESPIQKFEELIFLHSFPGAQSGTSSELIFVNDSVAEKKDNKDDGGSIALFKKALLAYTKEKKIDITTTGESDENFESFTMFNGKIRVSFTSVEEQATKGSASESPEEKRKRMENRGEDGKLRERKGGAVLSGLEIPTPEGFRVVNAERVVRVMMDGDCTIPIAAFIGDAAYAILQLGHTAYLADLKSAGTCVSIVSAESGGGDAGTQARVQNRKLFFSGFTVPFLFPELTLKYKYTGTTQLPAKAFRGDIDFAKAKLPTVQPNVDLGCLALLISYLNAQGGTIDSGSTTIRDNIASSTMTSSDLANEWNKTYGPIFTSAVGLCRTLKPDDFAALPSWCTSFIEGMEARHYNTLFGDTSTPEVDALFATMGKYKGAKESDRPSVLDQIKDDLQKVFPEVA